MARATNGPVTKRRHKKVLKAAKGNVGGRGKLYRTARETVERGMAFATEHRRLKKRDFRGLWITRITAAARKNDISYSKFMAGLKKSNVILDRKSISEIAKNDPAAFQELVKLAKSN